LDSSLFGGRKEEKTPGGGRQPRQSGKRREEERSAYVSAKRGKTEISVTPMRKTKKRGEVGKTNVSFEGKRETELFSNGHERRAKLPSFPSVRKRKGGKYFDRHGGGGGEVGGGCVRKGGGMGDIMMN